MFFRESNPNRFRPNFGIYGTEGGFYPDGTFTYCAFSNTQLATFRPSDSLDGTFTYCAFSNTQLTTFRPSDSLDGTFTYCAFDLNNSGFDRTP